MIILKDGKIIGNRLDEKVSLNTIMAKLKSLYKENF